MTRADLKLEGLTVLTGPSHSGKTAVMRAVETALYNPAGATYVRVGAPAAEIGLRFTTLEGQLITWIYSKGKSSSMDVNGRSYEKLGRGPVESEVEVAGFAPVQVGDHQLTPHFQRQLQPLFGVTEKSTTLFNLLLSFAETEKLPDIRKSIDQDIRQLKERRAAAVSIADRQEKTLGVLRQLAADVVDSAEVDEVYAVEADLKKYLALTGLFSRLTAIDENLTNLVEMQDEASDGFLDELQTCDRLLSSVDSIESHVLKHRKAGLDRSVAQTLSDELSELLTELELLIEGFELYEKTSALEMRHSNLRSKLLSVELENPDGRIKNLDEAIAEFDTCPTCGAPITDGHYDPSRSAPATGAVTRSESYSRHKSGDSSDRAVGDRESDQRLRL